MKSLIIGAGQVGSSLHQVIGGDIQDISELNEGKYDIVHICFPYSLGFIKEVERYGKLYNPQYIVIHSTVPIGTSRQLSAFHSPIRGVHPNISESLKTFVKYLAAPSMNLRNYFESFGIPIKEVANPETTEFLKIYDTTQYGINILLEKWAYKFCKDNNLNYDIAYTDANTTYKEGYSKMGMPDVARPILKHMDGKIGGHCVVQNCQLFDSIFTKFIEEANETL